jgi:hypothetical protein
MGGDQALSGDEKPRPLLNISARLVSAGCGPIIRLCWLRCVARMVFL